MFSIIIPFFNEEQVFKENFHQLQELAQVAELIFVDSGSVDQSAEVVQKLGRVVSSERGRSQQMNAGAESASGEWLFFLHADCVIASQTLNKIIEDIKSKGYVGGCLYQVLDRPGVLYKLIAWIGNVRAKLTNVYYGDQGIFVKKDVFQRLKGFPSIPICEDIAFTRELRKQGRVGMVHAPILSSARRWNQDGVLKTSWMYIKILFAFHRNSDLTQLTGSYKNIR